MNGTKWIHQNPNAFIKNSMKDACCRNNKHENRRQYNQQKKLRVSKDCLLAALKHGDPIQSPKTTPSMSNLVNNGCNNGERGGKTSS